MSCYLFWFVSVCVCGRGGDWGCFVLRACNGYNGQQIYGHATVYESLQYPGLYMYPLYNILVWQLAVNHVQTLRLVIEWRGSILGLISMCSIRFDEYLVCCKYNSSVMLTLPARVQFTSPIVLCSCANHVISYHLTISYILLIWNRSQMVGI